VALNYAAVMVMDRLKEGGAALFMCGMKGATLANF
jgi:hypothetical protein